MGGGGGGGHYKIEYFVGSFLYILGLFKVKIWNGNIFWDRKFFLGMPDIPYSFLKSHTTITRHQEDKLSKATSSLSSPSSLRMKKS